MSPVQILKAARAKIEKPENWGKGPPSLRPGTYCASEAITCVEYDHRCFVLLCEGGGYDGWTPKWNDARERTHTEVLEAFDRAIALAEAQS